MSGASMSDPVATARGFHAEIAARAGEIEQARRLPNDLACKFADAGLYRITVPRAFGGAEVSPAAFLGMLEALAEADASAGWCLMIGTTTALNGAYLPADVAATIFGQANVITGGVFAPLGKAIREGDNYRVSGRWPWASGSQNCDWLSGGCVVIEDGKPKLLANGMPDSRMMLFPANKAVLHDTWHTSGMCGTGSLDMEVTDLMVPASHAVSLITDRPREPGPLYAFPVFGLLAMGISAVALGNARGAINELIDLAGAKRPTGSRKVLAERPVVQAEVAQAEAKLRGARAFLFEATEEAWADAQATGAISAEKRAALRLAATHMTHTAAAVVDVMYTHAGGTPVYNKSSLQRRFRDAHVMTQHMMIAPPTWELAGRVLLGLETDTSTL